MDLLYTDFKYRFITYGFITYKSKSVCNYIRIQICM